MQAKNRAVFLDRDGTIIEDRGHLSDPSQVVLIDGCVEALRRLVPHYLLFIVTNQSGIAKGLITAEDAARVNDYVVALLAAADIPIAEVFTCPHQRSDHCACIKPRRYFLDRAAARHNLDLSRCFAVGDHPHDVDFAAAAGAAGIYVLTGHGAKHRHELDTPAIITADIVKAVDHIVGKG